MIATPRRLVVKSAALAATLLWMGAAAPWAQAAEESPDAMIQRLSDEVLSTIRSDKSLQNGDVERVMAVVDSKIMPNVNFTRMTASATGPSWRKATPEQKQRLQTEFKHLLVRTYAGALKQVSDQTVEVKPLRSAPTDKEVVVRTVVKSKGEPVQLDYRMERTPGHGSGWKIYDLNVLGVWLVDNYRPQFAQQLNSGGVDALIKSLSERNQTNVAKGSKG
ncbi:ABC transporter substrate-binding protein [Ottowia sp. GY511]|uniref:Phospholipid-binding protein MlaC n=1 Tax=Ottowia flava TaxID=2675430 RepID=A0ABW4KXA0_9BURK|nr:ABC transporter substrate-binding protein [Ottowia sp. GY511]